MKLLENSTLESLASQISNAAIDCILDIKLESYSCKMVQSDKKQWKAYETSDRQPLSPPDEFLSISASPIGHNARMRHLSEPSCSGSDNDNDDQLLLDSISMRTLFDLQGVLNVAYPDYDFTAVKSSSFSLIPSVENVMDVVDGRFASTVHNYPAIREELWNAVETEIEPNTCRIYGYKGDYGGDPFCEDGCLWGVNFIFCNKSLKRLLLLSCRALSQNRLNLSGDQMWQLSDDEE